MKLRKEESNSVKNGIIFENTDDLSEIEEDFDLGFTPCKDGSFSVTPFEADGELLEFPSVFRGVSVTRIESYYEGIQGGSYVTRVVIPEGIRVIGYQGLAFLYSLTELHLPESLLLLDNFALDGCTALCGIDMPKGLKAIGQGAFYGCTRLERVGLNEGLLAIGDEAFCLCEALREIEIPATVDTVGVNPFVSCSSLFEIRVSGDNPHFTVEDGVLYTKNKEILISYPAAREGECFRVPDGVREIGSKAFCEMKHLTEVYLPESVEILPKHAFFFCASLKKVTMPREMAYLHREAFFASDNLEIEKY